MHSYQDQFIQPRWADCVFCVFSLGLCFVCSFALFNLFVCSHSFMFPWVVESFISLTVFGASITNLNEPPRALAASTIAWVRSHLLGRCKQKQHGLGGLLCRWPSITEWEMHITAQGPRLRNDLYCVEWDVKLYYTYIHCLYKIEHINCHHCPLQHSDDCFPFTPN